MSPDAPLATLHLPVRWGDMDALGHVNNAAYLTYIEQARIDALAGIEGSPWPGSDAEGPLLATVEITYRRPIRYPATVTVETRCTHLGRTSFTLAHRLTVDDDAIIDENERTVCAEAKTVLVWAEYRASRPVPVPPALRAALDPSAAPG